MTLSLMHLALSETDNVFLNTRRKTVLLVTVTTKDVRQTP